MFDGRRGAGQCEFPDCDGGSARMARNAPTLADGRGRRHPARVRAREEFAVASNGGPGATGEVARPGPAKRFAAATICQYRR